MSAKTKTACGAYCGTMVCDLEPLHPGDHRGYDVQHDAVQFWRTKCSLDELIQRALTCPTCEAPLVLVGCRCREYPFSIVNGLVLQGAPTLKKKR